MKKAAGLVVFALLVSASGVWAAEKVGMDAQRAAHREEMKSIKKAQRERRTSQPASTEPSKLQKFWKNEAERSGLSQSGDGIGGFVKSLNPVAFFKNQDQQYKSRNASSVK